MMCGKIYIKGGTSKHLIIYVQNKHIIALPVIGINHFPEEIIKTRSIYCYLLTLEWVTQSKSVLISSCDHF